MSKNAKAVRMVREFFRDVEKAGCAKQVWDLVTALRGPDDNDLDVKRDTTSHIRGRLLSLMENKNRLRIATPHYFIYQNRRSVNIVFATADRSGAHFANHIRRAAEVLNGK